MPELLTKSEREVLTLVACGLSNAQIAVIRITAERTTRGHITALRSKLSVSSRLQLALWAWRNGVVSIDDAWATLQEFRQNGM